MRRSRFCWKTAIFSDRLAFALLEKETLLENEIAEIFKDVRKRPEREHWYSKPTPRAYRHPAGKHRASWLRRRRRLRKHLPRRRLFP